MFFEVIYIHNLDLIFLVTNILKKADLTLECWEFIWNDDLFGWWWTYSGEGKRFRIKFTVL